jgi:hypothetical protein
VSLDGIINCNEIYSDGVDWIVGHRVGTSGTLVRTVVNLLVPLNAENFWNTVMLDFQD